MSQGDCPRRQKNMDIEGLLESICREFIENLLRFYGKLKLQVSSERLSAKYQPISGEFSKIVINNMETKLNLRKKIKWCREPCRATGR